MVPGDTRCLVDMEMVDMDMMVVSLHSGSVANVKEPIIDSFKAGEVEHLQ